MLKIKDKIICKVHLIISVIIVIPVAFIYGFNPSIEFDIYLQTTDEHNFFKAIMGLYLGFSILWLIGIFKKDYLKLAVVTNIIFMLGLGFGRLISIVTDGVPTPAYIYGTICEFILGCYGFWVLKSRCLKK